VSLKNTILGILIDGPRHGYDLKRALSPALPRQRLMNDGILYPLLARMEKEGLVRSRVEPGDGRPDRRVFEPTAAGRRVFFDWLRGPAFEEDEVTYDFFLGHPFLTKCMFFKHLSREEVRAKLAAQAETAAAKLEAFYRIREGMVERGADPLRIAILDLGVAQQREKIRWLEKLGNELDRILSQARTGGGNV
jgi:DNA-binding PadR family transcriptional regulator